MILLTYMYSLFKITINYHHGKNEFAEIFKNLIRYRFENNFLDH